MSHCSTHLDRHLLVDLSVLSEDLAKPSKFCAVRQKRRKLFYNLIILNIDLIVYSLFALCEYSAVLSNIFFHQQSYNVAKDTYLLIIDEHQPLDEKGMWSVWQDGTRYQCHNLTYLKVVNVVYLNRESGRKGRETLRKYNKWSSLKCYSYEWFSRGQLNCVISFPGLSLFDLERVCGVTNFLPDKFVKNTTIKTRQ